MSTENETWREDSQEENASREGNSNYNREGGYNRPSYNRENNYNRDGNRPYGDRPSRPSYNRYGNDRQSGGYDRDRQSSGGYNRQGGGGYNRPQGGGYNRPYQNREGGDRPYQNRDSSDRPYQSREGGGYNRPHPNREGGDQPYRPRINREGGDQQRSGGYRSNSYGNNQGGGWKPRTNNYGNSGYGNSYGNSGYNRPGGDDRPRRPRFTPGGGDGRSQGFSRPVRRTGGYDPNAKYSVKKQIEYKEQFVDPNEPIRLNKYLANAGVCSRREADEFITAGAVSVNGEVVTELGTKIKCGDEVKFRDAPVSLERKIYVLLNKPKNCVTTSDDPQDRYTVMDLVKGACTERIYPVGRLDRNTTGVLLLTNDGDLASKLTHPQYLKKKIYHVQADKNITKADMDKIAEGIELEDGVIRADEISYVDDVKRNQVGIEIHSGKNRIVRRIFESLGYKVIRLDRVFFAGLTKKGLRRGDWRYLTEQEVNFLRMGSFE
ncbi:MAG: RNA-binding S4 domain-containing protein [Bacteroides sp.]|nr:RNA-binding S4 domain-containing protein [Bacteroides sp.]